MKLEIKILGKIKKSTIIETYFFTIIYYVYSVNTICSKRIV